MPVKESGVPLLLLGVDDVPVALVGKIPYVRIEAAIKWHQREVEESGGAWKRDSLDSLVGIRDGFFASRYAITA